jgi:hypothetical protein
MIQNILLPKQLIFLKSQINAIRVCIYVDKIFRNIVFLRKSPIFLHKIGLNRRKPGSDQISDNFFLIFTSMTFR